ncbi:flagellar assembly protein FliW [Butyrivibrio sp. WCD2001]|uniref:flagellar assembly protein FliW n=1 Tax=Butyrivibrio sp. WCD2001 TaxID=1280681 RepID=UPI000421E7C2|nr:flagellar assembly protein FliW [Butyrivibrio sp. WCD2001]
MKLNTRIFGEVDIEDQKIISMPFGLVGFPDLQKFALIHDKDRPVGSVWYLQSMDDPDIALPVIDPLCVKPNYNPQINEDEVEVLEPLTNKNLLMLVTISVPEDITNMTANLNAPILINVDTGKGAQIELENGKEEYVTKYPIYDYLKGKK